MPMTHDAFAIPVASGFPEADSATMIEIDFLMTEGLGIRLPQMKENAGRSFARLVLRRYFPGGLAGRRITVLAGKGGNGDIALLAARRLADWGAAITLVTGADPDRMRPGAAHELAIHARLGRVPGPLPSETPDLILDGLIGYSLRGDPTGRVAELIAWANAGGAPVLSLDLPSGFDAQDGRVRNPAIRADATLSLGLPKRGLLSQSFAHIAGALYLADISVPPEAWARMSLPLSVPSFGGEEMLRLLRSGEQA
jgi:NAD(P)H-hydrate epimerase